VIDVIINFLCDEYLDEKHHMSVAWWIKERGKICINIYGEKVKDCPYVTIKFTLLEVERILN